MLYVDISIAMAKILRDKIRIDNGVKFSDNNNSPAKGELREEMVQPTLIFQSSQTWTEGAQPNSREKQKEMHAIQHEPEKFVSKQIQKVKNIREFHLPISMKILETWIFSEVKPPGIS